jgi:hypothetical protein
LTATIFLAFWFFTRSCVNDGQAKSDRMRALSPEKVQGMLQDYSLSLSFFFFFLPSFSLFDTDAS